MNWQIWITGQKLKPILTALNAAAWLLLLKKVFPQEHIAILPHRPTEAPCE